jgi:hypothetical protein
MQQSHLRRSALFVLLPALALLAPAAARAADTAAELEGFGKAKFGFSEEQAKALYPKLQAVPMPTPKPGEGPPPFSLAYYTLDNQSFGSLKKCKVMLQFFQHELMSVEYSCAGGSKKIIDYLEKRFGPPPFVSQRRVLSWVFGSYSVTAMEAAGTFSIVDTARSKKMSSTVMSLINQKLRAKAATPVSSPSGENVTPAVTPKAPK